MQVREWRIPFCWYCTEVWRSYMQTVRTYARNDRFWDAESDFSSLDLENLRTIWETLPHLWNIHLIFVLYTEQLQYRTEQRWRPVSFYRSRSVLVSDRTNTRSWTNRTFSKNISATTTSKFQNSQIYTLSHAWKRTIFFVVPVFFWNRRLRSFYACLRSFYARLRSFYARLHSFLKKITCIKNSYAG